MLHDASELQERNDKKTLILKKANVRVNFECQTTEISRCIAEANAKRYRETQTIFPFFRLNLYLETFH